MLRCNNCWKYIFGVLQLLHLLRADHHGNQVSILLQDLIRYQRQMSLNACIYCDSAIVCQCTNVVALLGILCRQTTKCYMCYRQIWKFNFSKKKCTFFEFSEYYFFVYDFSKRSSTILDSVRNMLARAGSCKSCEFVQKIRTCTNCAQIMHNVLHKYYVLEKSSLTWVL